MSFWARVCRTRRTTTSRTSASWRTSLCCRASVTSRPSCGSYGAPSAARTSRTHRRDNTAATAVAGGTFRVAAFPASLCRCQYPYSISVVVVAWLGWLTCFPSASFVLSVSVLPAQRAERETGVQAGPPGEGAIPALPGRCPRPGRRAVSRAPLRLSSAGTAATATAAVVVTDDDCDDSDVAVLVWVLLLPYSLLVISVSVLFHTSFPGTQTSQGEVEQHSEQPACRCSAERGLRDKS